MDMTLDLQDERQRAAERLADAATAWRDGTRTDPQQWDELEAAAAEFVTAGLILAPADAGVRTSAMPATTDGPRPGFEQLIVSLRDEISQLQARLDAVSAPHGSDQHGAGADVADA